MQFFQAFIHDGQKATLQTITTDDLSAGELLIRVAYSDINYKDALAYQPHNQIIRQYPQTLGIDLSGTVVASQDPQFKKGDQILATGHGLGVSQGGGYAQYARIPASWAMPLPPNMTLETAMAFGTAGLTAALCVNALMQAGMTPEQNPQILVGGATGGVGSIALQLLENAGFSNRIAVVRTPDQQQQVRDLGATATLALDELPKGKALSRQQFDYAIDPLGGSFTSSLLPSMRYNGAVALCGNAAGTSLPLTVFPFILRNISWLGVDSVSAPNELRQEAWTALAKLNPVPFQKINLADLPQALNNHFTHHPVRTVVSMA
ncbi:MULTISPECIES: acryloyl-CoA reductase [Lacticaseibacillus]|uniref:Oxidoreductase n=1 Tax=Lacticaseibacillus casei DSM 20011 = JCM 1134 = ATCC 393 TaxID=1423732 RepID=A0AAD1ALR5_LACCA|nr:acryloyl-CoA reductase [Lacticaseibacillus casei]MBI6596500.1 acryloyl-CoA reductase [Lacticaseibacillus casei]MBO1480191.1 acryloyl-CoA reductase [Lacticaseibacillus casei]MBO2415576.1 acryloyl-CoA reductase [Lacticaseibacillus casei]MCK2079829.1 acryloyl-CoA reductase [Lacticaseibacillus casei]MDZ5495387.1 acryloyl-CoA reductase [Lacticaseibacillus casei]